LTAGFSLQYKTVLQGVTSRNLQARVIVFPNQGRLELKPVLNWYE
jgi:hypothetical protein